MRVLRLLIAMMFFSTGVQAQGSWSHMPEINGQHIGSISCVLALGTGDAWLASYENIPFTKHLFHFSDGVWTDESERFDHIVNDIDVDPNGNIYFCLGEVLVKYDDISWSQYEVQAHLFNISIDGNGGVWCSPAEAGYLKFQDSEWIHFDGPGGRIEVKPDGEQWAKYGNPYYIEEYHNGCANYA